MAGNGLYKNESWLTEQYVTKKLSTYTIADMCDVTPRTIRLQLINQNIPLRDSPTAIHLSHFNSASLSQIQNEMLDGLLLGDGGLQCRSRFSARYGHSDKHEEYLLYLKKLMPFKCNILSATSRKKYTFFRLTTLDYIELKHEFDRWYINGEKHVPEDVHITPESIYHWYTGDGTYSARGYFYLAANGFTKNECEYLIEKLRDIDIHATYQKCGNIWIRKRSIERFFDTIGACRCKCYNYKFPIKKIKEDKNNGYIEKN